ncbi:peptidoglycan bridge formation glycyltransferase FemA/FemB family protein [Candidatus Parcubacteria bacterium]|nr:peptidoglycan bridge formation glycyltransferase FemA/FemB family protein [Candidatus Parcubacteria bacterium]
MQNCQIREISNKQIWEDFLLECKDKTFLDSWNWGEFQKATGSKIWRFGIFKWSRPDLDPLLVSVALVIKVEAKRGTFLFAPHAPVIKKSSDVGSLKLLLEELRKLAREENCSFIRISPIWQKNEENIKIFKDLGFRDAPIHMHPEITWELDISPSEEELLTNMRKTTRYLIRQGLKDKDIEIIQSQNVKDVEKFNELYQETVSRHHFAPFSLNYLKNEFLAFNSDNQISIFLGKYKNEVVASSMIIFWQGKAFYHQGASSHKYSKIPVSYLMQWEAIKEAKKRGCEIYNFWGIAPESFSKKHPWWGLTLFKKGFGGYKKEYVKTQDFVISQKYWLNYIIEIARKHRRGL